MLTVVYTAIIRNGPGPWALRPPARPEPGIKYVVFSDDQSLERPDYWELRKPQYQNDDPVRVSRWCKILSNRHFPNADTSVWLDSTIAPNRGLTAVVESSLKAAPMASFAHPTRSTVVQEGYEIVHAGLDSELKVKTHLRLLATLGYPDNFGLHETTVVIRRHNPAVSIFNERWWDMVDIGSRRDQLSFDPTIWLCGIGCAEIAPLGLGPWNVRLNPYFSYRAIVDQDYRQYARSARPPDAKS